MKYDRAFRLEAAASGRTNRNQIKSDLYHYYTSVGKQPPLNQSIRAREDNGDPNSTVFVDRGNKVISSAAMIAVFRNYCDRNG